MKKRIIWFLVLSAPISYIATRGHELDPETRAKAACRGEIVRRLKDPDSAEFGKSLAVRKDSGVWIVYREVSAKNSFGAVIKSAHTCVVAADFSTVKVQ